jgi:hypothetical protein
METKTQSEQTREKPRELIRKFIEKRERAIELANDILIKGYEEFSFEGERPANANQEGYKEDPVYKKLTGEVLLIGSERGDGFRVIDSAETDHGIKLKCEDLAENLRYRRMDKRTYTFLLENSIEIIAKHLYYNHWEI